MVEKVGAGPRKLEYFLRDKILVRAISGGSILGSIDNDKYLTNDKIHIIYNPFNFNIFFILAVINSDFVDKWIKSNFGNLLEIKINQLQEIPIPNISQLEQQKIAEKCQQMLDLHKELQATSINTDKYNSIKNDIEKLDREIDNEVYKLYGLTQGGLG
jgi:restriction endonuclease S subunit